MLLAASAVTAVASASARASLFFDVKATDYNATTHVLTPSIAPAGFAMTTVGAPTLVSNATPNGSSAISFNGTSDAFEFNQVIGGGNMTVLAFLTPGPATTSPQTIMAASTQSFDWRIAPSNNQIPLAQEVLAAQSKYFGHSNTALTAGTFSGIAATVQAGTAGTPVNYYLNGAADGTENTDRTLFGISRLGAAQLNGAGGDQEYFAGQIAEVRMYNTILSQTEIQAIQDQFVAQYVTVNAGALFWTGNTSSVWDSTAADNFAISSGTVTQFQNNVSAVTFSSLKPASTNPVTNSNISIQSGGVTPLGVNVTGSSVNYTFADADGVNGIKGITGITKDGTSTLTLSGSNSFTGAVIINGGKVIVNAAGALGSTSGVTVNSSGNLTVAAGITLPSSIPVTLDSGDTVIPALTFAMNTAADTVTYSGPITVSADSVISNTNGTLNLASAVSGAGGLGFTSASVINVTGTSSYTGQTIINGGQVNLTGSITSGSLNLAAHDNANEASRLAINGGSATFNGTSISSITPGWFGNASAVVVNSGTLNITGELFVGPGYQSYGELLTNGGTVNIGGTVNVGNPYGTGVITVAAGSTVNATKGVLAGQPVYAQAVVNLNGGTLVTPNLAGALSNAHLAFSGGTLKATADSPALITGMTSAYIYSGGATVDDGGKTVTIPQSLSAPDGSGLTSVPITAAGKGYGYAPIVQFTGGTLTPNGSPATGYANYSNGQVTGITITNPGNYTDTTGVTAKLYGGGGTAPVVGPLVAATNLSGGFTKAGTGTLVLSGNNTYTGPTNINAGTLKVSSHGTPVTTLLNPSFENVVLSGVDYQYNPTDPAWNFQGQSGLANGNSGFLINGTPPDGNQVAFLQNLGYVQQTLTFPTSGAYTLSFYTSQRFFDNTTAQMLDVYLDDPSNGGLDLGNGGFTPGDQFAPVTFVFNATAGDHILTFQGLEADPAQDNTAFVDAITLNANAVAGAATNGIPDASPVVMGANATLDLNNSVETVGSLTGPTSAAVLIGSGALAVGGDGSNASFAGVISGTGSLTKTGAGVQTLTGANTYTGGTVINAGTLKFASPGALPSFTALTVNAGATAVAAPFTTTKNTLFVSSLTLSGSSNAWTGKLDLNNNDLIVRNGSLATITNQLKQGFNAGGTVWQGAGGITTSAAGTSPSLYALGVIQNSTTGLPTGGAIYTTFDGQSVTSADVLVKFTYYGDADLNGRVNGNDYNQIDFAFTHPNTVSGWQNGDFNYDGKIDGSDYSLIDNAFNRQGAVISSTPASMVAETASLVAGAPTAVPEPTSIALLAVGSLGLMTRRKRRN